MFRRGGDSGRIRPNTAQLIRPHPSIAALAYVLLDCAVAWQRQPLGISPFDHQLDQMVLAAEILAPCDFGIHACVSLFPERPVSRVAGGPSLWGRFARCFCIPRLDRPIVIDVCGIEFEHSEYLIGDYGAIVIAA